MIILLWSLFKNFHVIYVGISNKVFEFDFFSSVTLFINYDNRFRENSF
jgi:hypothetical protein